MKDIFKIFTIFTPRQQVYCAFIILCMVIGAVLEAVGIGAILPLISIMGDESFLEKHIEIKQYAVLFQINTHTSFIIFCAGLLLSLYVVKNLYMAWLNKLQVEFSVTNQIFYARELLAQYLNKPYLYHIDQNSATLLRNVSDGARVVFTGILIPTFMLITEFITVLAIWGMLVLVDAFTAIVVAGLLGLMMYGIIKSFRKKITERGQVQNKYSTLYIKWLNQGLGAIKETKVLRKESYFLDEFHKSYQNFGLASGDFTFINQLPKLVIETIVTAGLLILIILKIAMGIRPMEIVPLLGVLALASFRLMPCANRIVSLSNSLKFQMPLFGIIYNDLIEIKKRKLVNENIYIEKSENKLSFKEKVEIRNLSFKYPKVKKEVLNKISFDIPKGSFIGIIGQSGAGKTTFVDIMLGLIEPTSGDILVDDKSIFDDIRKWQANLSYVPQTIYLIDGTIRENIALGIADEDVDDEKINKVVKMAELSGFIDELPKKINTNVGERGVKLSGGQRQRIGIARALYYDPEVLILDEATSALDNETEQSITDTILKLKGELTIIAIAHRMTTLKNCDFKIKLKDGKAEII